MKWVAYVTQIG